MASKRTTVTVDNDTRERFRLFVRSVGAGSSDEALNELLDIAATEAYWNGAGEPTTVSKKRIEELERSERQLAQAVTTLKERVDELEDS